MSGEWVPPLFEALLAGGALDVYGSWTLQKKGRPGLLLTTLARPEQAQAVGEILLRHSTTLGVRSHLTHRQVLERWLESVDTPFGAVRLKVVLDPAGRKRAAPEYEDCAACAAQHRVPVGQVMEAAQVAWNKTR